MCACTVHNIVCICIFVFLCFLVAAAKHWNLLPNAITCVTNFATFRLTVANLINSKLLLYVNFSFFYIHQSIRPIFSLTFTIFKFLI